MTLSLYVLYCGAVIIYCNTVVQGHQRGARGHQVTRKDQVGLPRACSKNNISLINLFTLTNINTKII